MNEEYSGLCVDCNKVNTTSKDRDEFVCAACCNHRYYQSVANGEIVEINFRKSDYKQGTAEQIYAILATQKVQPINPPTP